MKPFIASLAKPYFLSRAMKRAKGLTGPIVAGTCLIVLLAGCGNNSNNNGTASGDTTATTAANATADGGLVGTWSVVSATEYQRGEEQQGGQGRPFYGENPKGRLILDANGHYMLTVLVDDLPDFVDSATRRPLGRHEGTDAMNKSVVAGSIANFGTYRDSSGTLILSIEKATYPNWDGITQRRTYVIRGNELEYRVPEASGGNGTTAKFIWRRMQ